MFSGITRGLFDVVEVTREADLMRYGVDLGGYAEGLAIGASVSIDGVCQTVVSLEDGVARFDAIAETLARTTLGGLSVGRRVSVERSLRLGDEIGGHEVSGHVIGTGEIRERRARGHEVSLSVGVDPDWMRFILPKGFVALDGSSLTIGETGQACFWVHLVPETLRLTALGDKAPSDLVNVELDARTVAIVETVERILARRG